MTNSSSKLIQHPKALCNQVRRIASAAGDVIMTYFDGIDHANIQDKSDGSPVTQADRSAEALIEKKLFEIMPDIPVVGEESAEAGRIPDISGAEYFWLIDPLDGTKEFISGSGDFTVNIALIRRGNPVLGVVYAPFTGEMYSGIVGEGAAMVREDLVNGHARKDKPIKVRKPQKAGLVVMSSKSHGNSDKLEKFLGNYKVARLVRRGSSLKICQIASAKADLYPRLGPTCEWDTAAGDAVLRGAGGVMTDESGSPLTDRKSVV